jgi:dTDP-4-dehydrorhamnose reductase
MTVGPGRRRWLVVGAGGMLGADLLGELGGRHVTALRHADLDITDTSAVAAAVRGHDVVVNAAGWTAVDDAEAHEPAAFEANATGPANLARACRAAGAWLLHVSTDYVFAGDADEPYDEDASTGPRSAYGRTKLAGEWAVRAELPDRHWLVRTAWLYGAGGPNFVSTMRRLEAERDSVDVVDDQTGQPTWSAELARRLVDVVEVGAPAGTYHGTAAGSTTWYGLARAVFELAGADPGRVRPTTTGTFPRPAPRPAWSVLGHRRWAAAGLEPMRDWRAALQDAWKVLGTDAERPSA